MSDWNSPPGPFDIPDIPDFIPRRLKPWIFVFFVLVIQFSGGLYLAAATDMVGTTALMQEDILMAGYAQLIGMSINFCVMFRLKFRFSNRVGLLICCSYLIAATFICARTTCVPLLVGVCLFAGWFRMWATLLCNSTIQLWITPKRDMAVFFCYVYLLVDGAIQIGGIMTVYTAFRWQWEYMHWIIMGALAIVILLVLILVRPYRGPMRIPLLGIDWIGSVLWAITFMAFTFICVYGNFYDWWDSREIVGATIIGMACICINLWRATFLHHPYVSFKALTNRSVVRATMIYLVFYTLMGTEHVFEHSYAETILGFDETNMVDLNIYVLAGILVGCAITWLTFARRRWRYKTMTVIAFSFAVVYLCYFYFRIDYGMEKESLFVPLFCRGCASVIISIVFLTSVQQGGLHFFVFPQALTINGFTGAVMGATLGPAIIGEFLRQVMAKNMALLSSGFTHVSRDLGSSGIGELYGMVAKQALVVSMKEIYGWLLIGGLIFLLIILVSYGPMRPMAIFPKWRTVIRVLRHEVKVSAKGLDG